MKQVRAIDCKQGAVRAVRHNGKQAIVMCRNRYNLDVEQLTAVIV